MWSQYGLVVVRTEYAEVSRKSIGELTIKTVNFKCAFIIQLLEYRSIQRTKCWARQIDWIDVQTGTTQLDACICIQLIFCLSSMQINVADLRN